MPCLALEGQESQEPIHNNATGPFARRISSAGQEPLKRGEASFRNPSFLSASAHKQGVSELLGFPVSVRVLYTVLSFVRGGGISSTQQGSYLSLELRGGGRGHVWQMVGRWESRVGVARLACSCSCQWLLQQADPEGQIKLGHDGVTGGSAGGQQVKIS